MAAKHPKFQRPNRAVSKRVSLSWRKPRGIDSKQRMHLNWAGARPDIGFRSARATRGLHPSGAKEVLVRNAKEFDAAAQGCVIRFAAKLGGRSRALLRMKAAERGVKVLN